MVCHVYLFKKVSQDSKNRRASSYPQFHSRIKDPPDPLCAFGQDLSCRGSTGLGNLPAYRAHLDEGKDCLR